MIAADQNIHSHQASFMGAAKNATRNSASWSCGLEAGEYHYSPSTLVDIGVENCALGRQMVGPMP